MTPQDAVSEIHTVGNYGIDSLASSTRKFKEIKRAGRRAGYGEGKYRYTRDEATYKPVRFSFKQTHCYVKKGKKTDWRNVNPDHIFDDLKELIVNCVGRIMVL